MRCAADAADADPQFPTAIDGQDREAVAGERRLRILTLLAGDDAGEETARLCRISGEVTRMTGAGIMLRSGDLPRGSLCTTDEASARNEQLQYDLGEGPSVDAYQLDRPVLEPDLRQPASPRWLAFTGPALDAGARAVFAFPLRVGAVRLGALNLHSDRSGPPDDDQHADALVMADIAAHAVLLLQAHAPPGRLAAELEAEPSSSTSCTKRPAWSPSSSRST